jgi:hypothetical protein
VERKQNLERRVEHCRSVINRAQQLSAEVEAVEGAMFALVESLPRDPPPGFVITQQDIDANQQQLNIERRWQFAPPLEDACPSACDASSAPRDNYGVRLH